MYCCKAHEPTLALHLFSICRSKLKQSKLERFDTYLAVLTANTDHFNVQQKISLHLMNESER